MVNIELKHAVSGVLNQLTMVLSQINDEDYSKPVEILNNATIGQHIRHTLEFFTCLLNGSIQGVVNYDRRNHNRTIEEEKRQALTTVTSIINFVEKIENNLNLKLEVDYGIENDLTNTIDSNLNRELAYNIEHAIHHMAIMKVGIQSLCPYVKMPPNFGVANSTVRYQNHHSKLGESH